MNKKSENPFLASIQEIIEDKFDLESWPSQEHDDIDVVGDGDWIDVHIFQEESYVFSVGVENDQLMIVSWGSSVRGDISISLYDDKIVEKIMEQIEKIISMI